MMSGQHSQAFQVRLAVDLATEHDGDPQLIVGSPIPLPSSQHILEYFVVGYHELGHKTISFVFFCLFNI